MEKISSHVHRSMQNTLFKCASIFSINQPVAITRQRRTHMWAEEESAGNIMQRRRYSRWKGINSVKISNQRIKQNMRRPSGEIRRKPLQRRKRHRKQKCKRAYVDIPRCHMKKRVNSGESERESRLRVAFWTFWRLKRFIIIKWIRFLAPDQSGFMNQRTNNFRWKGNSHGMSN